MSKSFLWNVLKCPWKRNKKPFPIWCAAQKPLGCTSARRGRCPAPAFWFSVATLEVFFMLPWQRVLNKFFRSLSCEEIWSEPQLDAISCQQNKQNNWYAQFMSFKSVSGSSRHVPFDFFDRKCVCCGGPQRLLNGCPVSLKGWSSLYFAMKDKCLGSHRATYA